MAAPAGVKVKVYSVEEAAKALKDGLKVPSIMLAKTPLTYEKIVDLGAHIPAINIGGMGISGERKTLYKNIAADPQERDAIRKFLDQGIQVKIQVIPADKVVDVAGLL